MPIATIRPATPDDREAVAVMLARAFHDDPAFAWIFPDPGDRAARLPRLFRLLYDSAGRAGMRLVVDGAAAATLWRRPGHARTGPGEMLTRAAPLVAALGGNIGRALRIGHAIEARLPARGCWYLHYAGCDPACQGRGLGRAAVLAGLERSDGLPIHLETAVEANVVFYERLGFAITDDWLACPGGPRFWSLRRR
ncbi:MAG: GNAT family N-acetyltransferase [Sphingomonas sp.]